MHAVTPTSAQVSERIRVYLHERDVRFEALADGSLVLEHGSAEVTVDIDDLDGATVIRARAIVLDDVEAVGEQRSALLAALNDRNRSLRFGRFFFEPDPGRVVLDYEILGDDLQAEELFNAVTSVAQIADDHDDLLLAELGVGARAADRRPAPSPD